MKLKSYLFSIFLICSSLILTSSDCGGGGGVDPTPADPCDSITCSYDGECNQGICVCTMLTQNYIIGTWVSSSTTITFKTGGEYDTSFGTIGTYLIDSTNRIINLDNESELWEIDTDGFTCDKFHDNLFNETFNRQ